MSFRNLFYGILIIALTYLLICPRVHKFSEIVKHDVLPKITADLVNKNIKKDVNLTFSKFSYYQKSLLKPQLKTIQVLFIFSSTHLTLNLAIVSTPILLL